MLYLECSAKPSHIESLHCFLCISLSWILVFPSLAVVAHNLADLLLTLSPSGPLTFSPSGPLLVLLMAFSIGLMYYNVQPPREMSAYRRSHARGFLVYFATCALTCGILLVSVGVKHCMHSTIAAGGELSTGHAWLLHGSLVLVLHSIFRLRFGHYFNWSYSP